ncbi:flagellar filament capping protein FliD [Waltera intestinalis]|uniref:Flagellar hook-associated protein 2 n=1 Tax=Waltera intestinalis TaxID=2606635 RepID=A0A6L5YLK2_9FIRM|nr:flagellar filament capping protein FliD [Waltera intestinalis]MCI6516111.1 flagellar filament capping protein FliD [Lachnospiraceae bacterium]MST58853.1 flagellar filament capping protein FliD [Waltera intestinalis]
MAMRMSGLMSGMDTESIIQELVSVKQTKVDDAKKAQTKLQWKQDAWKELNTKLKNLQAKYVANMRFVSSYSKRTTKVSNSNAVSVITGENAVNGVQSLQINQLAKTGYLTGAQIKAADGSSLTAASKLSDLGVTGEGTFNITAGGKSVDITVNGDSTISDVLNKLKEAGVNANFDAKNQRFFVSASASGADNDFSITASDSTGDAALAALGLKVGLTGDKGDKATLAKYQEYAAFYVSGDDAATLANINKDGRITKDIDSKVSSYLEQYKSLLSTKSDAQKKIDEINEKYKDSSLDTVENYTKQLEAKQKEKTELEEKIKNLTDGVEKDTAQKELDTLNEEIKALSEKKTDAQSLESTQKSITDADTKIADIQKHITVTEGTDADGNATYTAEATQNLKDQVNNSYLSQAKYASEVITAINNGSYTATGATKVSGQDAMITLNGAEFTGSTNVFEINGLTFTALNETKAGEDITVTTEDDVDGIYDMVKSFLKEYNSIINEMDKLYNADSAKGYEPLTDDEKDAMSDSEVEKYETKIKDALLRRDSNLSTVSSALKEIMSGGVDVNGKTMYLSDFGIETLGYFEAADNEKNAYHIAGDPDDANTSGKSDVLKSMISNDPDTVISFFSSLSKTLYTKMSDLSKSVDGYRSYGSFYDDKKMTSDYNDYKTKISELEEKLNDYEDKWYSKFSKMETALAKLQSNSSAVTSLLGGS